MELRTIGAYDFPARDRQELFGDDQLIHVVWEGNVFICSPGCFRVPRAMTWEDFRSQIVDPWASADPDFRPDQAVDFRSDEEPLDPQPGQTIGQLGIPHKGLVKFRLS